MVSKIEILKVLACLSVMALASAPAFADSSSGPYDPNANPNCSPGQKGCSANYATGDVTSSKPYDPNANPNCSPGQQGCSANYPTTDHSEDNPNKPAKQPPNN